MEGELCDVCEGLLDGSSSVLRLSDDKDHYEFRGHNTCLDELENEIKSIKGLQKMKIKDVLSKLNIK